MKTRAAATSRPKPFSWCLKSTKTKIGFCRFCFLKTWSELLKVKKASRKSSYLTIIVQVAAWLLSPKSSWTWRRSRRGRKGGKREGSGEQQQQQQRQQRQQQQRQQQPTPDNRRHKKYETRPKSTWLFRASLTVDVDVAIVVDVVADSSCHSASTSSKRSNNNISSSSKMSWSPSSFYFQCHHQSEKTKIKFRNWAVPKKKKLRNLNHRLSPFLLLRSFSSIFGFLGFFTFWSNFEVSLEAKKFPCARKSWESFSSQRILILNEREKKFNRRLFLDDFVASFLLPKQEKKNDFLFKKFFFFCFSRTRNALQSLPVYYSPSNLTKSTESCLEWQPSNA